MRLFWYLPSVMVFYNCPVIFSASFAIGEVFYIVANCDDDLICHKSFVHQVQHEKISHLTEDELCLFSLIGAMQDLS